MIPYNTRAVSIALAMLSFAPTICTSTAQDVGCCSHDFKTCADWCIDVTNSTQCGTCESPEYGTLLIWLDQPMDNSTCVPRWDECTHAPTDGTCCPDLVCYQRSVGYRQCLHPLDIEELERSASPTTSPIPSASPTVTPSQSPTPVPTTKNPTQSPTSSPTNAPTQSPSNNPTHSPSTSPSDSPSSSPTNLRRPTSPSSIVNDVKTFETNEQENSTWKEYLWLWVILIVLGGILMCLALTYLVTGLLGGQKDKTREFDTDDDEKEPGSEEADRQEEADQEQLSTSAVSI